MKKNVVLVDVHEHLMVSALGARTMKMVDIWRDTNVRPECRHVYMPTRSSLNRLQSVLYENVGLKLTDIYKAESIQVH